jgi:hypothetical protein
MFAKAVVAGLLEIASGSLRESYFRTLAGSNVFRLAVKRALASLAGFILILKSRRLHLFFFDQTIV